jgi:hypothetical protein
MEGQKKQYYITEKREDLRLHIKQHYESFGERPIVADISRHYKITPASISQKLESIRRGLQKNGFMPRLEGSEKKYTINFLCTWEPPESYYLPPEKMKDPWGVLSNLMGEKLIRAGYKTPEFTQHVTDEKLLSINGFGQKSLSILRKLFPEIKFLESECSILNDRQS